MALPVLSMETLDKLDIDITSDNLKTHPEDLLSKVDIEPAKVSDLLDDAEEKLQSLHILGFNSLAKLQKSLVEALSSLLKLLGTPGASIEEIHRLIFKIGILQDEIRHNIKFFERQQVINTEIEIMIENELEKEFEERFAAPTPDYEEDLLEDLTPPAKTPLSPKILPATAIPAASVIPPASAMSPTTTAAPAGIEFILKKSNSLVSPPFKNAHVSLRLEAKLHTLSQTLKLSCDKSADGHTFTFRDGRNPDFKCDIIFANNGVHFISKDGKNESLEVLKSAIQAHENALSELGLDTQWRIRAPDQTSALKAMDVMKSCGASIDNLISIKLADPTLQMEPQHSAKPVEIDSTPISANLSQKKP